MNYPEESLVIEEVEREGQGISFPSGAVIVGDPCYYDRLMDSFDIKDMEAFLASPTSFIEIEDCAIIKVNSDMKVRVFGKGRVASWQVGAYEKHPRNRGDFNSIVLGVDSGQMCMIDLRTFLTGWKEVEYDDQRIYEHKETGKRLQYRVDFPHYDSPIASENGKTMNQLVATKEWDELPYQGLIDWSYNGVSHCHDNGNDASILGGRALVTGTGWGDGSYDLGFYTKTDGVAEMVEIAFIGEDEEE